jgi:hypothetical protein
MLARALGSNCPIQLMPGECCMAEILRISSSRQQLAFFCATSGNQQGQAALRMVI